MDPNNSYTPKTSKDARINPEIMEKQPMIAKSKHAASFIMGKELNVTGFEKGVEECGGDDNGEGGGDNHGGDGVRDNGDEYFVFKVVSKRWKSRAPEIGPCGLV
ncbi:hypothetical protein JHK85_024973 [Glycine max]|nr:hypothetical protein JHK85_024973 [Glycine max]